MCECHDGFLLLFLSPILECLTLNPLAESLDVWRSFHYLAIHCVVDVHHAVVLGAVVLLPIEFRGLASTCCPHRIDQHLGNVYLPGPL